MVSFVGRMRTDAEPGPGALVTGYWNANDEWVYVAVSGGVTKIWSGGACSECSVDLLSVRRCQIHRDLVMVAVQCRLL